MNNINTYHWQTKVSIDRPPFKLSYSSKIFAIGSCFAVNMSHRLQALKFQVCANPFGIMYNPVSIYKNFQLLNDSRPWSDENIFNNQGLWRDFLFHSDMNDRDRLAFCKKVKRVIASSKEQLMHSDFIILTLGTAFVWKLRSSSEIVANCHKMPARMFERMLLSRGTLLKSLEGIISIIDELNPAAKILFSVSPIRHIRDGLVDNSKSKARLIDCVHTLQDRMPTKLSYYPSYEIVMDELRDYRFYAKDMLHPSEQAVDYISDVFLDTYLASGDHKLLASIQQIARNLAHHASNEQSPEHKAHLQMTLLQIKGVLEKYPHLNFEQEVQKIDQQLAN